MPAGAAPAAAGHHHGRAADGACCGVCAGRHVCGLRLLCQPGQHVLSPWLSQQDHALLACLPSALQPSTAPRLKRLCSLHACVCAWWPALAAPAPLCCAVALLLELKCKPSLLSCCTSCGCMHAARSSASRRPRQRDDGADAVTRVWWPSSCTSSHQGVRVIACYVGEDFYISTRVKAPGNRCRVAFRSGSVIQCICNSLTTLIPLFCRAAAPRHAAASCQVGDGVRARRQCASVRES